MASSSSTGFQFLDDVSQLEPDPASLTLPLPATILHKRDLLMMYAHGLDMPGYFGWNWDAFEECLRTLEWVKVKRVVIVHEGLPFQPDYENRATYLSILQSAVQSWGPNEDHELIAIFPERCRAEVESLLG